ncbi:MAG: transposase, partial [Chthoniobacterales bacterium]|nr:transposase [Chthoniobacterales bacterium]
PMIFEGTCHSELFETWIEKFLIKELAPGQIFIMDNAAFQSRVLHFTFESAGLIKVFVEKLRG